MASELAMFSNIRRYKYNINLNGYYDLDDIKLIALLKDFERDIENMVDQKALNLFYNEFVSTNSGTVKQIGSIKDMLENPLPK